MQENIFCVGAGSGFSGDRLDAAEPVVDTLIARGKPAGLIFETLAERTLALGQLARRDNPELGYEPKLRELLEPVLRKCVHNNIPIIGNFGAANPRGAARLIERLGREAGLNALRIAVVEGDDIRDSVDLNQLEVFESDAGLKVNVNPEDIVAANVYLGAAEIVHALRSGAQIVVTGRVADPALALAPLIYHFKWAMDDWHKLAAGTLAGHLVECSSQVTGGYFADPGVKDVPDLTNVGFPIAEVNSAGEVIISKADHSGGLVSEQTVKEQLLYEIHDPGAYLTPDVIMDINRVTVSQLAADRVLVKGVRGKPRPDTLKATASFNGGWLGEGEISYAGANAMARARLAAQVLRERLQKLFPGVPYRIDLIGVSSVFDSDNGALWQNVTDAGDRDDIRIRLALAADQRTIADTAAREVLGLYLNGPAGGGGVRWGVTACIKTLSYLVPRARIAARMSFFDNAGKPA
jgi:hypothetical protein